MSFQDTSISKTKMKKFQLVSPFVPTGDQPEAIEALTKNLQNNAREQVLLGVTGSGKTFTMANVIANVQRPTLVISHNKTLAAQLYQEFRDFFRITPYRISFLITIITSRKPIYRNPIRI